MSDMRLSTIQSKLASAKEMTISGSDAYMVYLKLKKCDELLEENIKLRGIIKEVRSKLDTAKI